MVIRSLPGIVWAVLRALVLGALMGPIYKILASFQYLYHSNSELVWLWKKYPKRSYDKFTAALWINSVNNSNWHLADAVRADIEHKFPSEPFPVVKLVTNTLLILLAIPFRSALGFIQGPIFVLREHFEHE